MSTLSSASTFDQVWASFLDNASYEEDDSRTKALAFKTACIFLLGKFRPTYAMRTDQQITLEGITKLFEDVDAWLSANPLVSGEASHMTRYFSMENFRG
jgi:hypothetical protein